MSVIYQVWWGRRSLAETFWLWSVVVGGLLIDAPYWVSLGLAAMRPAVFGNALCTGNGIPIIYVYLVPAVAVKAWLAVGLVRSRSRFAAPWSFLMKALALFAGVLLMPLVAIVIFAIIVPSCGQ